MVWKRENVQWEAVLRENALLMSEEKGQTALRLSEGNINSNNYWLQLRYVAEHLKMRYKQQKTTPGTG